MGDRRFNRQSQLYPYVMMNGARFRCPPGGVPEEDGRRRALMFPRVDKEADNSFFAERLGGFQSVQALNENETSAVRPHQDRRLLTLSSMLAAISSTRFCSRVARRLTGT